MLQQLSKFFIYNISLNSYLYVYEHFRLADLDPQSTWLWIVGFFALDFGYYWFHRGAHEINLFWATHVVIACRYALIVTCIKCKNRYIILLNIIIKPLLYVKVYFKLIALGYSICLGLSSCLHHCMSFTNNSIPFSSTGKWFYRQHLQVCKLIYKPCRIHTEVIGNLGPLEYIINTPSAHRVHHGRNPYCIDKNYAGTLIIWDIFFGTFELERTAPLFKSVDIEPVAFGLTHPINTFDPFTVQFHHLNHVLRTCWSTPNFTNKLKVLFYGPGWHDDTPRMGLFQEIPPIARDIPPQKYDPPVSLGISIYVVLHFAILIVVNAILLDYQPGELDFGVVLTVSSYIFLTLTSFGRIFDHKSLAVEVESFRSILVCVALEVGKQKSIIPSQVVVALQLMQLMSGLWLMITQRSTLHKKEIKTE